MIEWINLELKLLTVWFELSSGDRCISIDFILLLQNKTGKK